MLLFVIDWFYLKSKDVVRCKVIFLSQQFYNKLCLKDNICHNIMVSYNVCWSCHHNITIKRLCDDTIDPTTSHEEYERLKKQTSYRYLRELSIPTHILLQSLERFTSFLKSLQMNRLYFAAQGHEFKIYAWCYFLFLRNSWGKITIKGSWVIRRAKM